MVQPGVLQVALSLQPGGTERLIIEICKRVRAVMPVAVCCIDGRGAWADELEAAGVEVVALNRQPGFQPRLAWRIRAVARARNLRILHCHQYSPFVYGVLARLAAPGLRVIYTEHGRLSDAPPSLKRRLVTPALSVLADKAFAVSEDLRRYVVTAGYRESRIGVITNGVEPGPARDSRARESSRNMLGVGIDSLVAIAVGRLDPVKDIPTLLAAVTRVENSKLRLFIAGDGPERNRIARLIADLGLGTRVTLLGHQDRIRELLPGADIYVNSSISEGISLTLLEAMAAELPVIATAVGGTPEVVLDGVTGVLVPPGAPELLAAALRNLLVSARERRRMGIAGRKRVEQAFTLDRMTADYLGVYRNAVARHAFGAV